MAKSKYISFTAARLRKLTPGDTIQTYKDINKRGFQVRVHPSGKVTFEVYRKPRGSYAPVRVRIGYFPDMKLADASDRADEINALLNQGINPNQRAREIREQDAAENMTLAQGFERYIKAKQLSPATLNNYTRAIDRDMQDWKPKPLMGITREMVLTRYTEIEEAHGKTPAQRMAQTLRAVWNFCNDMADDGGMPYGICPVQILNKQRKAWSRTDSRARRIREEELPAWFEAVRAEGGKAGTYLEFLMLTGCRRREATSLRWEQIDFNKGTLTFLRTKNGTDHTLPMTKRVRELFKTRRKEDPHSTGPFRLDDPRKAIIRVMKASGTEFSSHDLRRSFTSLADLSGAGQYAIKAILNHATGNDVTGAHYAKYDDPRDLLAPLQKIEDYILSKAKAHDVEVLRVVK